MKVYDILTESGVKHLSKEEVNEYLKTDFSDAFEQAQNHHFLFRGFGDMDIVYDLFQPLRGRESVNTNNFYTLIMNNDPRFKNLPKRSVITTTDKNVAKVYSSSDSAIGVIFPKNGTSMGVVPKNDIWNTAPKGLEGTKVGYFEWGKTLERILSEFMYPTDVKTYSDLMTANEKFLEFISEPENYDKMYSVIYFRLRSYSIPENFIDNMMKNGLKPYYEMIDPETFKLVKPTQIGQLEDNQEVWFDEEFIAISLPFIEEFIS